MDMGGILSVASEIPMNQPVPKESGRDELAGAMRVTRDPNPNESSTIRSAKCYLRSITANSIPTPHRNPSGTFDSRTRITVFNSVYALRVNLTEGGYYHQLFHPISRTSIRPPPSTSFRYELTQYLTMTTTITRGNRIGSRNKAGIISIGNEHYGMNSIVDDNMATEENRAGCFRIGENREKGPFTKQSMLRAEESYARLARDHARALSDPDLKTGRRPLQVRDERPYVADMRNLSMVSGNTFGTDNPNGVIMVACNRYGENVRVENNRTRVENRALYTVVGQNHRSSMPLEGESYDPLQNMLWQSVHQAYNNQKLYTNQKAHASHDFVNEQAYPNQAFDYQQAYADQQAYANQAYANEQAYMNQVYANQQALANQAYAIQQTYTNQG